MDDALKKILDEIKADKEKTKILLDYLGIKPVETKVLDEGAKEWFENLLKITQGKQSDLSNIETIKELEILKQQQKDMLKYLAEERQQRLDAQKSIEESNRKNKEKEIGELVEAMKKDGRLPAENKELESQYKRMLELDLETSKKIVEQLPKNPNLEKTNMPPVNPVTPAMPLMTKPDEAKSKLMNDAKNYFKESVKK